MGVIIIALEGACHTQCSRVIMKCLFKGAPCFLPQRKGRVLRLHSHGHTDCHVERAPSPTAATLSDTPQLPLWVQTGRSILILHPLGAMDAHSCAQLFSWISNVCLLGFGCCCVFFFFNSTWFFSSLINPSILASDPVSDSWNKANIYHYPLSAFRNCSKIQLYQ